MQTGGRFGNFPDYFERLWSNYSIGPAGSDLQEYFEPCLGLLL